MIKNILITGRPGCGKSSLIEKLVKGKKVGGVFTPEMREEDKRLGFKIIDLASKKEGVLASVDVKGPKVSKYGVNFEDLENIGVKAIEKAVGEAQIIVIDELGKMELFSSNFKKAVEKALNSEKKVIATVSLKSFDPFIEKVKKRKDCMLFYLTKENFDEVYKEISNIL